MSIDYPKPDIIRVMGIDPGTTTLGVSFIDIPIDNLDKPRLVYSQTIHIKPEKELSHRSVIDGDRHTRIDEIGQEIGNLIQSALPTFIATETPFMRRGKMSAFESGIEVQDMIRRTIRKISATMIINGYNPMMVKHYVGVDHIKTTKDDVLAAINGIFKDDTDIDIMTLDEHSSDSVAVAYTFYRKDILIQPPIFIRPKKDKPSTPRRRRRRLRKK